MQKTLGSIKAQYGDEHYETAMNQIKKEGLSDVAAFVCVGA